MAILERQYESSIDAPVALAMNRQYGMDCGGPGVWTYTIAAEGEPGGMWVPYVRRIAKEGVGECEVPAHLGRGGAFAAACTGPTPEVARRTLFVRCA